MADHRRRVRCCTGRVQWFHFPVRAVWLAARQGRCRQLLHQVGLCAAGTHARWPGQGGGAVFGGHRHHFWLVDRQRGDHRHLHHPAHEAGRLPTRSGRCGRGVELGERPDHAAGDGRGRLPDGGVCRYPLHRGDEARVPAGHHLLHRTALHRAPGGPQGQHGRTAAPRHGHGRPASDVVCHDRGRVHRALRCGVLGHWLDQDRHGRHRHLGGQRRSAGQLCRPALVWRQTARPGAGRPERPRVRTA
ncbi:hypothetical protein FQZ97_810940 [compost metagenome]